MGDLVYLAVLGMTWDIWGWHCGGSIECWYGWDRCVGLWKVAWYGIAGVGWILCGRLDGWMDGWMLFLLLQDAECESS